MTQQPPPQGPPPGSPEYLEHGTGGPLPSSPRRRRSRRPLVIGAGAVVGLAAVGASLWAVTSFLATGPQPAEALPADTLGYLSVDLDPSGSQKVEAVRTLQKFPAFADEIDLDTDDDIRQRIFEEIESSGACSGLDYEADIEPWLGDRMAFAAVDTGAELPAAVFVLQVTDAGAAEEGLTALQGCATGGDELSDSDTGDEFGGWAIDGDWAILAETGEVAEEVRDLADDGTLADDEDFQRWTDEAGDPGIVSMYAAPEAGDFIAGALDEFGGFAPYAECSATPEPAEPMTLGPAEGVALHAPGPAGVDDCDSLGDAEQTEALRSLFEDFAGAAVTVRFDDGSLEVESASSVDFLGLQSISGSDQGADVLETLPDDTAAAMGVGFEHGWFTDLLEYAERFSGGVMSVDDMVAEAEDATGLDLPEDAETLAGESAAVAVGSDVNLDDLATSEDGSDLPIGVKVKGDPEEIEGVLDKLASSGQVPSDVRALVESDSEGDMVAIGPNDDYRAELLERGDLGDTDTFQQVVREADDASAVLFVNFDAGGGWLSSLAEGDPTVEENLEPLVGLGVSSWEEDGVGHSVLRVTTD